MASGKTFYLSNHFLDRTFGQVAYTPPSTVYLALYTVAPTASTGGTEVSAPSYTRAAVANDLTHFSTAASGVKATNLDISFPVANEDWGNIVAVAWLDAPSGGNILYFGSLDEAKTALNGEQVKFLAGSLTFDET